MADDKTATLSKGGLTSVDILLTHQIEHIMAKQVMELAVPKQNPPLTYIIDLQRLKETINVDGVLEDTNSESALTKKNNLRTLMQSSGSYTLSWGSGATAQSYTGNSIHVGVKEVVGRIGNEGSQNKIFEVKLQFHLGTHKG